MEKPTNMWIKIEDNALVNMDTIESIVIISNKNMDNKYTHSIVLQSISQHEYVYRQFSDKAETEKRLNALLKKLNKKEGA